MGDLLEGEGPMFKTNSMNAVVAAQKVKRDVNQKLQVAQLPDAHWYLPFLEGRDQKAIFRMKVKFCCFFFYYYMHFNGFS